MKWFGSIQAIKGVGALAAWMLVGSIASQPAAGQSVLFHGGGATASNGSDGAVLAYLQTLFGQDNVTYMQGALAAADGCIRLSVCLCCLAS